LLPLLAGFAFRWTFFAVLWGLLGSAWVGGDTTVGWVYVGVATCDVVRCVVVFFDGGVDRRGGFDFRGGGVLVGGGVTGAGAGTGVGSVGVGTVVGGGSSARAAFEAKRPNAPAVARATSRSGNRDRHPLSERISSGKLQVLPYNDPGRGDCRRNSSVSKAAEEAACG
jgi:hypothetical protein